MTDSPNTAKARAEAIFRKAAKDARSDAMADYRARQQVEIDSAVQGDEDRKREAEKLVSK